MADCFTCKFRNKMEQEEPCVNCEKMQIVSLEQKMNLSQ